MEAQVPLGNIRRKLGTTAVLVLAGAVVVAGLSSLDWSWRSVGSWISSRVNSNIHIPFTDWQLELRLRAVDGSLAAPGSIQDFSTQHPISAKLYSIGVLCSPRVTLLWGRLFDNRMLQLLHEHVDEQQVHLQAAVAARLPASWGLSSSATGPSAALDALQELSRSSSQALFWPLWLLFPGLQVAYYSLFFTSAAPLKVLYTCVIGAVRTVVELSALWRCATGLWKAERRTLIMRSLACCYLLPLIMTLQSLSVLLWLCLFLPGWIVHISMAAFYLWGPPMMLGLMTTAWAPLARNALAEAVQVGINGAPPADAAPAGQPGDGMVEAEVAVGGRLQAFVKRMAGEEAPCHWPPPVEVPESFEELTDVPRAFMCPITHSIMREPAVACTGASYERSAITEWLKTRSRCPLTGRPLRSDQLSPNLALYSTLQDWVDARRDAK